MILLIDNYDSFVHNLARYFQCLGQRTHVVRNDATDVGAIRRERPAAIVLSPGPCTPEQAGCSLEIVSRLAGEIPILGVCLGHQAIGQAFGGRVVRAPQPMHGRTSLVYHEGQGIFAGLPSPLTVCRYHSLVIDPATVPDELEVQARTADGVVMAVRHRTAAVYGVQFHPESILTEQGHRLLANFLHQIGLESPDSVAELPGELQTSAPSFSPLGATPITF